MFLLEGFEQQRPVREQLQAVLEQASAVLKPVKGSVVIIGWSATAAADFHPTPLHAKCPGSLVHGAIVNAMGGASGSPAAE